MNGKVAGVRYGYVVNDNDTSGAGRLGIRLQPEDNSKKNGEIEVTAFPLLPKMFYVKPKLGEGVFVFLATNNDGESQRYYIGPVISQQHRMYYEPYFMGGDSYQKGSPKEFDPNPFRDENAYGAYQETSDVAILGRKNCDILIKDDDIRIRAGAKVVNDESKYKVGFNRTNPAFIKLKYHENALDGDNKSTVSLVGDKILLLSNKSGQVGTNGGSINKEDQTNNSGVADDLITDNQINNILQEAYRLPYGEILVDVLRKMIMVFNAHTHDYVSLPPNALFVEEMNAIKQQYLDGSKPPLLSDTVRIN